MYESRLRFLGLPLVHVATGRMEQGRYSRGIARGWIAVGDIAFGGLIAVGGLAVGTLSVGGLALGWAAAVGGLAVAREFALGGAALGAHANDATAREFFQQPPARFAQRALHQARWLGLLVLIPILVGLRSAQEDCPAPRDRAT